MILLFLAAAAASCASPQTTAEITRCIGDEYIRADAEMTRQWKITHAYMKGRDAQNKSRGGGFGYAAALLESQRAWLLYREKQCVIAGGEFAGGSAMPMAMARCRADLTKMRTKELQTLNWRR